MKINEKITLKDILTITAPLQLIKIYQENKLLYYGKCHERHTLYNYDFIKDNKIKIIYGLYHDEQQKDIIYIILK